MRRKPRLVAVVLAALTGAISMFSLWMHSLASPPQPPPLDDGPDLLDPHLRARAAPPLAIGVTIWVVLVLLHEASRLAEATVTATGRAYGLWDATGLLALAHRDAWLDWTCLGEVGCAGRDVPELVWPFVFAFALLQLVLILAVTAVFLGYFRPARPAVSDPVAEGVPSDGRLAALRRLIVALLGPRWLPVIALVAAAASFQLELALFLPAAFHVETDPLIHAIAAVISCVVAVCHTIVWAALLLTLLLLIVNRDSLLRIRLRSSWGPVRRGLRTQRLALIGVVVLVVMGTVSGHGVLEQVPDVVRGWLLSGGDDWNWPHLVLAFVLVALVGAALWFIGRQRAGWVRVAADGREQIRGSTPWVAWICIGLTVVVAGMYVMALGVAEDRNPWLFVDWLVTLGFLFAILALLGISRLVGPLERDRTRHTTRADADAALLVGDILPPLFAAALLVAMGKAYFGPLLIGEDLAAPWKVAVATFVPVLVAIAGVPALVALSPAIAERLGRVSGVLRLAVDPRIDGHPDPSSGSSVSYRASNIRALEGSIAETPGVTTDTAESLARARYERWNLLLKTATGLAVGLAAAVLLFALIWPRWMAGLGPFALLVALLGSWLIVLAAVSMWLGKRRPLPVFERLGMRTDPVLVLALVIPTVLSQLGGAAGLHAVDDNDADRLPTTRPSIAGLIADWQGELDCARQADPEDPDSFVRPIIFAAAEGGGIRAAEWTVDVLERFRTQRCSRDVIAMSSGVSGGAVGLALIHQSGNRPIKEFVVGRPEVVALAVDGLLVRDAIAGLTGLRIPSSAGGRLRWEDRAALIESQWRLDGSRMDQQFTTERRSPTGYVVLNSLAANLDCKVLVSQVDLNPLEAGGPNDLPVNCYERDSELSTTIDLIDYLGDCPLNLDWATAAMLAARFPYVTPAGRIEGKTIDPDDPECAGIEDLQLIDGGYFENSGLATLSDSAPQIVAAVSLLNADADGTREHPYVVPVVMFMHNEPGGDVLTERETLAPEIAVPVLNLDAGAAQYQPDSWLSRLSDELADVCAVARTNGAGAACDNVVATFREDRVPHGVAVVAPSTAASLSVPLGWTLSGASEEQLREDVIAGLAYRTDGCGKHEEARYYADFGQLMCAVLGPPAR